MYTILYVDDDPGLLEITKLFLESSGDFSVTTMTSAVTAADSPGTLQFDAILSDYQMPLMDGISFLKKIREKSPDIPFILFTGRGREEVVIEAINSGADFYLQKGGKSDALFAELGHKIRISVERRRARDEIKDSRQHLTDILNFLPDSTFAIDTRGVVIAWNKAITAMTGIQAQEMLGRDNYEYALPLYGTRRPMLLDLLFEPEEKIAGFYSHIHRDGTTLLAESRMGGTTGKTVYLLGKASPLYNSKGEVTGAIESIRDISIIRQAEVDLQAAYVQITADKEELRTQYVGLAKSEARIRERETQLWAIFNGAPYGIAINDAKTGEYLSANPTFEKWCGFTVPELLGKTPHGLNFITLDELDRIRRELARQGRVEQMHLDVKARDGKEISVLVSIVPIPLSKRTILLTMIAGVPDPKRDDALSRRYKGKADKNASGHPGQGSKTGRPSRSEP